MFIHDDARDEANCTCVQGPKKSTPQLIKPRRQDLVDELQLRINHSVPETPTGMQHEEHDMHNDAHVNNLVQELDTEATSGSESTFMEKLREKPKPLWTDAVHVSTVEPSIALNTKHSKKESPRRIQTVSLSDCPSGSYRPRCRASGPEKNRREYSAKCVITSKISKHTPPPLSTTSAALCRGKHRTGHCQIQGASINHVNSRKIVPTVVPSIAEIRKHCVISQKTIVLVLLSHTQHRTNDCRVQGVVPKATKIHIRECIHCRTKHRARK